VARNVRHPPSPPAPPRRSSTAVGAPPNAPGRPSGSRPTRPNLSDVVRRGAPRRRPGLRGRLPARRARPRSAGLGPRCRHRRAGRGDRRGPGGCSKANKEALARLVTRGDRQAVPRGARRGAGDHRHLRLSSWARAAACTARRSRRRCPNKQLFTFPHAGSASRRSSTAGNFPGAVPSVVPRAGDPSAATRVVWKPAEYSAGDRVGDDGDLPRRRRSRRGVPQTSSTPTAPRRSPGSRRGARGSGSSTRSASTGSSAVGAENRRAVRGRPPAVAVPGARREEPDGRHGRRGPRPRGGGRPVRRLWHRRASAARRSAPRSSTPACTTSSCCGWTRGLRAAPIGDPKRDVLYGPNAATSRFAERFEEWLGLIRPHHTPHGLDRPGPDSRRPARRARASSATPRAGIFYHPTFRVRRHDRGRHLQHRGRSAPARRRRALRVVRRGDGVGQRPTATGSRRRSTPTSPTHRVPLSASRSAPALVSINNSTSGAEAHLPFGGNGKSGNGLAPVGHLGARPVHPLAVGELGLRRKAAEGARWTWWRSRPWRDFPARRGARF